VATTVKSGTNNHFSSNVTGVLPGLPLVKTVIRWTAYQSPGVPKTGRDVQTPMQSTKKAISNVVSPRVVGVSLLMP